MNGLRYHQHQWQYLYTPSLYAASTFFLFYNNKKEENRYDDDDARMTAMPRGVFCF